MGTSWEIMLPTTLLPEHLFGLTIIEARRRVRPGEGITLQFRARNASDQPTQEARLTFIVPAGWTPLDETEADLPSLAPAGTHVMRLRVRADVADAKTAQSTFQVAIGVARTVRGSNCVRVRVVGHPRFDPGRSGVRIAADDDGTFRVTAEIANDGDAAARNIHLEVPAPPGFRAEAATTAGHACLEPGETFAFGYRLTPVAPNATTVRINDAAVTHAGGRHALVTTQPLVLAADIIAPDVHLERRAHRLDGTIRIANTGWVAARGVVCAIDLPAEWRLVRGAMLAGTAPIPAKHERRAGGSTSVTLPFVPSRGEIELRFVAVASRPPSGDDVAVRCDGHIVRTIVPVAAVRALHLHASAAAAFAEPGTPVSLTIDVLNVGETAESVALTIDSDPAAIHELHPGHGITLDGRTRIPTDAVAGAERTITVRAVAADGIARATATVPVRVCTPCDEPVESAPEETPEAHAIEASWASTATVRYGERFHVCLRLVTHGTYERICIRPTASADAVYVAGSTTINGCPIVDEDDGAAFFSVHGLTIYDLPDATTATIGWSVLPRVHGDLTFTAEVIANDDPIDLAPLSVHIPAPPPFAGRPDALPFHVDATTVADPDGVRGERVDVPRASALPAAERTFALSLDAARIETIRRVLGGTRGRTVVHHLPALTVLFPSTFATDDAMCSNAFRTAAEFVRSVYERLFIKLRIPGYDMTSFDLEDEAMRRAVRAFFDTPLPQAAQLGDEPRLVVTIDEAGWSAARAVITSAPLGSAAMLATIGRLLPTAGQAATGSAIGAYAAALVAELDAARAYDNDAFAAYLTMHHAPELDAARSAVLAPIDAEHPLLPAPPVPA